jgi:hypothetical protein
MQRRSGRYGTVEVKRWAWLALGAHHDLVTHAGEAKAARTRRPTERPTAKARTGTTAVFRRDLRGNKEEDRSMSIKA